MKKELARDLVAGEPSQRQPKEYFSLRKERFPRHCTLVPVPPYRCEQYRTSRCPTRTNYCHFGPGMHPCDGLPGGHSTIDRGCTGRRSLL